MTTLEQQIAEMKAKLEELEKQKKLEEERMKEPLQLINFNFNLSSQTLSFQLSRNDPGFEEALSLLKSHSDYKWTNTHYIHFNDLEGFLIAGREYNVKCETGFNDKINKIKAWISQPDIEVSLHNDSTILIKQIKVKNLWLRLESFRSAGGDFNSFYVSRHEAWLLKDALTQSQPSAKIVYSEEVEKIIDDQIKQRAIIEDIATAEDTEWLSGNPNIDSAMRPFQRVGARFIELAGGSALIAFDMGLGKTLTSLALSEKDKRKTLIIAPTHLTLNWQREIQKWTGKASRIFTGIAPDRAAIEDLLKSDRYQYYIIGFAIIGREEKDKEDKDNSIMPWVKVLSFADIERVIIDEAHYMRNMSSQRSRGARLLAKEISSRILLSGGPVVNRPGDMWPILNTIDPLSFQSDYAFERDFTTNDGRAKNVDYFHKVIKPIVLRKKKEDVIKNLPAIERFPIHHDLSQNAREAYKNVLEGIYRSLLRPDWQDDVKNLLVQLLRLKQISSQDKTNTSVETALDAYQDTGHKVLIYSQFLDSIHEIHRLLNLHDPNSALLITGKMTNMNDRYALMDKFQTEDSIRYLACSTHAASEGLTLTAAHTIIFNDLNWTAEIHKQAESRAWGRLNDLHGAQSHYVLASGTIDEFLMEILKRKHSTSSYMIDKLRAEEDFDESVVMELLNHIRKEARI